MTKQEEIRGGIACISCGNKDICYNQKPAVNGQAVGDVCSIQLQKADQILQFEASQGVVIKIRQGLAVTDELISWSDVATAGYVAVEPLIKEA